MTLKSILISLALLWSLSSNCQNFANSDMLEVAQGHEFHSPVAHPRAGASEAAEKYWYPFLPSNTYAQKSQIGLEDWNEEPAGKHGRILAKGDKLLYEGKEIKLWGLNNCYALCKPTKESADKHAAFYRKFGINAVRFHKYADNFGEAGILDNSFVKFDPNGLDKMDYYISVLKENGIYTKLSPTFGVRIGKEDAHRVPWVNEIGDLNEKERVRATYGSIYFSHELQDLQIEQTTKLLRHHNPYTEKRYAQDPAIFCVEMFNEDAILWEGSTWTMQRYPTLRVRTAKRFSDYLLQKYGSEEKWESAWGEAVIYQTSLNMENSMLKNLIQLAKVKGLPLSNESLATGTVVPWSRPWIYDSLMKPGEEGFQVLRQRMLDTAEFLIGLQNEFYDRFRTAIQQTGYEGEIIGSNWQAGSSIGHYLNLHSDAQVGMIDRHNYYGGGGTHAFERKEEFSDGSMLAHPGKGILGMGLQQVADRPFMISEWIHVIPNEYVGEGPAILGAYGWGLNGWDASFMFQNGDDGGFSPLVQSRYDRWDVTNPAVMANFMTIARQVRRMDVTEGKETQFLNVHLPSLKKGKLDFIGETKQQFDEKTFTTNKVPAAALAATKVAVQFTKDFKTTPQFDIDDHSVGGTVVSTTQELKWTPADPGEEKGGFFTLNTEATKAFVGFSPGNTTYDLGDGYTIRPQKGYAIIYLSAKNEGETLKTTNEIVMTVMGRARNTGMVFNKEENRVLDPGGTPIVLEPVSAEIMVPFKGQLLLLDHDGVATKATKKISQSIQVNGSADQTPFYLLKLNKNQ